jgi:hypothetical protein
LTRRYDRPAIPDRIVAAFQKPMNKRMDRLEKKQAAIVETFSQVVSEMRISIPANEEPPFAIALLLVTERLEISETEAQAVDQVMAEIAQDGSCTSA